MSGVLSFRHRSITGWATDFSSVPRLEPWPSVALDDQLQSDLGVAVRRAQEAGYNELILWGLGAGRTWSSLLPETLSPDRTRRVREIVADIRAHGLKLLWGVGVYSWGYDTIIAEHPELDGGSEVAMCLSEPRSRHWVERILDYIVDQFDPDGFSMQSSDLGRCPCDRCARLPNVSYHGTVISQTASYMKERWPGKMVHVSTWGLDLGEPRDREAILDMARQVDVLNDQANSADRAGEGARRELARALADRSGCDYGTEGGWYIDPPPAWERDRWFIPIARRNVDYFRRLRADGGRAVERYILPLANPGAEAGFIFDGFLLQDVERDAEQALGEALGRVFDPTPTALEALMEVWTAVEGAFLDNTLLGTHEQPIHLTQAHYGGRSLEGHRRWRPEYLLRMSPRGLEAYGEALREAAATIHAIRTGLRNRDRAETLARTVSVTLSDVERVQTRWGTPV